MDSERFDAACAAAAARDRGGIGTLGEKGIHNALKHYYEPDPSCHEIPVGGYIADIVGEHGIIEIQSGSFGKMRDKLSCFLAVTSVTIVYPCIVNKRVIRIAPDTGEVISCRRSPKHGCEYDILRELRGLGDIVRSDRLTVVIAMLEADEYRTAQPRRRWGATDKLEKIPTALLGEIRLASPEDYRRFIPDSLPREFTSQVFADAAGITLRQAQDALCILTRIGSAQRIGKEGRSYLYRLSSE